MQSFTACMALLRANTAFRVDKSLDFCSLVLSTLSPYCDYWPHSKILCIIHVCTMSILTITVSHKVGVCIIHVNLNFHSEV